MPDSIIILKSFINWTWTTFSSIPFFDWPGVSFADVFVGTIFWSILWFLIHNFAFRRGDGIFFINSAQDYGRSAIAKSRARKKKTKLSDSAYADFVINNT